MEMFCSLLILVRTLLLIFPTHSLVCIIVLSLSLLYCIPTALLPNARPHSLKG